MKKFVGVFCVSLFIIVAIGIVVMGVRDLKSFGNPFKKEAGANTIKTELVKSTASAAISAAVGKDVDVKTFIEERVSEEDAAFINELIEEKVDVETVAEIMESYKEEGNISPDTVVEMSDKFSDEEKERIKDLAKEYGPEFADFIQEQ